MSLAKVIDSIDASECALEEHQVASAIQESKKSGDLDGDAVEQVQAEWAAFMFMEGASSMNSGWGTYFGPYSILPNEQGQMQESPSIKNVDDTRIAYWRGRARACKHPILRARYADLAWDLCRPATGQSPDPDDARLAIDAYVASSRLEGYPFARVVLKKLERALSLALSLGDDSRRDSARDALIEFENGHAKDGIPGTWGESFDLLVQNKKVPLADEQERGIIHSLEGRLKRTATPGEKEFDPHAAESAARRLATYYRAKNQNEEVERVLSLYGGAFAHMSEKAMPLLASEWMLGVYRTYEEFGLREAAKALNPKLAELGERAKGDMKKVTYEMEVPAEDLKEFLDGLLGETFDASIYRIVGQFIEDRDAVEARLKEMAKVAPLQAMFSITLKGDAGQNEASLGSVEGDLEGRVVHQMARNVGLSAFWLNHAMAKLVRRFGASADDFVAFCAESPAYVDEDLPLLKRSFQAYLDDDNATAAHLLVPRIEQAVRRTVMALGGPHLRPGRFGGQQLRLLPELLNDTKPLLGDQTVYYLHVLLTDQRGLNLRNKIAHGMIPGTSFGRTISDRLVHAALLFGSFREDGGAEDGRDAPEDAGGQ